MRGNAVRYLAKSGGIEVNLESVEYEPQSRTFTRRLLLLAPV